MTPHQSRRRAETGFTLVELLVVVAISGLLTVLMATGFRTTDLGWRHVATRDASRDTCLALRDFLRNLLAQSYPAIIEDADNHKIVDFDGQPDQITFLAPLAQRFGATDIVRYTLHFSRDGNLHLAWRLDRSGAEDFASNHDTDTVIAGSITQYRIAYFGNDSPQDAPTWRDAWTGQTALPKLMLIRMNPCPDAGYGDLVVVPSITEAGCLNRALGKCGA